MPQYDFGTVEVTHNSQTVTGSGTEWLSFIQPGALFSLEDSRVWYEVSEVLSDTEITLTSNYLGDSEVGASYALHTSFTPDIGLPVIDFGDINTGGLLQQAFGTIEAALKAMRLTGVGFQPNAIGTLTQREAYDDEDQNFLFLRTDVTPFELFIKQTGDSGDWSPAFPFQGPVGDRGPVGDPLEIRFNPDNVEILEFRVQGSGSPWEPVANGDLDALVGPWRIEASEHAEAALQSKQNAADSETAAAASASSVAGSATDAAISATNALTSEQNASDSESAADQSASAAAESASAAAEYATDAAQSEDAAEGSAISAEGSEFAAGISESNAAASASAAAVSKADAKSEATAAAISASAASTSEANALQSEMNTLDTWLTFSRRFLGDKSEEPTADNLGNSLKVGALYFDTTTNQIRSWSGTEWLNAYANLSDVVQTLNGRKGNVTLEAGDVTGALGFTPFSTAGGTIDGSVTITGDLTVQGDTITLDVGSISVEDAVIELAKNNTGGLTFGGIKMERGATDAFWVFNEDTDRWTAYISGDDLATRTKGDIEAETFHGNLTGNAGSATKLEMARSINGQTFDGTQDVTLNTGHIAEGSNLYYSDGRARSAISTSGALSYNPTTGVITIPAIPSGGQTGSVLTKTASTNYATEWRALAIADISGLHTAIDEKLDASANAVSASVLATTRTINGTSFDGSTNITTFRWGTSRTITIGDTGKSVNGSENVSWSLAEIGAAAASHTHVISDTDGLQSALDSKAGAAHGHVIADVTGLQSALDDKLPTSIIGTGPDQVPTNNLVAGVPTGCILMWSGSVASIPTGWFLCDGTNGTPDLRNRFIVGAGGAYDPGDTGGADSVTLTQAQMPAHNHTGSTNSTGNHSHQLYYALSGVASGVPSRGPTTGWAANRASTLANGAHSHSLSINNRGGGGSHENRPPYYALCYIMKG